MCKKLPSDAADFVMEAVPLLTNLLQYHDSKVMSLASNNSNKRIELATGIVFSSLCILRYVYRCWSMLPFV